MQNVYEHAFIWDEYYDSTLISDVLNTIIKVYYVYYVAQI